MLAFSFSISWYASVAVYSKICFTISPCVAFLAVGEITSGVGEGGSKNQVLFGSDLSQVDKDLIFEGLKKLYKKKVGDRGYS